MNAGFDKFDFFKVLLLLSILLVWFYFFPTLLKNFKKEWKRSNKLKKTIGVFFLLVSFFVVTAFITKVIIFDLNLL